MIKPVNVLRHEIIGLPVKIERSTDRTMKGLRGTVIDETRNMLIIRVRGRMVKVPKSNVKVRFSLPDGMMVDVEGRRLMGRSEDRLKTRVRRW